MPAAAAAIGLAMLAALAPAQDAGTGAAIDLKGKLYKAVFISGAGALAPADLEAVPPPLRERLREYLERRAAFKSRYKSEPDSLAEVRADAKKRVVERGIVALVDAPGIERIAAGFVAGAPIDDEWEGLPQGPLAEAAHAEDVLKKDPDSVLAPWLYVFIAQRQRVAFEAYENEKNQEGMKAAARKYRAFVERARAAKDPVYRALVDDMERQPSLYIKGTAHPRDFDPDS